MIVYDRKKNPVGMLNPDGGLSAFKKDNLLLDDQTEKAAPMCSNGFIALKIALRWICFADILAVIGFFGGFYIMLPHTEIMTSLVAFGIQTAALIVLALVWKSAYPFLLFSLGQVLCYGLLRLIASRYIYTEAETAGLELAFATLFVLFFVLEFAELIMFRIYLQEAVTESHIPGYVRMSNDKSFWRYLFLALICCWAMYSGFTLILFEEFGAKSFLSESVRTGVLKYTGENETIIVSAVAFRIAEALQLFLAQNHMTILEKDLKKNETL